MHRGYLPDESNKWWLICQILSNKYYLICRINPANRELFAGVIQQIVTYFPDNQDLGKRKGSHAYFFYF